MLNSWWMMWRERKWKCQLLHRVHFFANPWTVAHQASLSMEFSRQEFWSGLPFPSSGDLPNPSIKPRSPALQEDSLLSEPSRKPKNTGVSSLSLLQGNFPTQGLNQGLLYCRGILYQLGYPGSPGKGLSGRNTCNLSKWALLACSVVSDSLKPHEL